jgi:hypothetical protein
VGLGFLPEPGWFAFQSDSEANAVFQTIAVASNVPLEPEDDVAGRADASGLPYATLLKLPADGIVIVASFTRASRFLATLSGRPTPQGQRLRRLDPFYPERELPLHMSEATPYLQYGTQIRPDQPLGQYQLRAVVNEHYVDLQIYFGSPQPSQALVEAAQSQLDRLVVGGELPRTSLPTARSSLASTAQSQSVTLTFVRFFDVACNCYKARVSGRVSSGRAGEYVVVLHEYCGRGGGRAIVAATTRDGGAWQAEISPVARPDFPIAEWYRARWNDELSEPVTFRGRLSSVSGKRAGSGRQTVTVVTPNYNPVNMKGREIVLQRQVSGRWTRVASARLAPHRTRFYTFTAAFTVPRRGWKLRTLVPSKAAAPCFTATASEPWTS